MDKPSLTQKDDQLHIDVSQISERFSVGLVTGIEDQVRSSVLPLLPDEVTALDQLRDSLNYLATVKNFDIEEFDQTINQLIEQDSQRTLRAERDKAIQWAKRGKVEIFDEESNEPKWINLPNAVIPKFTQALNDVGLNPDEELYNQQSFRDMTEEEFSVFAENTTITIVNKTSDLILSLPTMQQLTSGELDGVKLVSSADLPNVDRDVLSYSPGNPVLKSIRKKVIHLSRAINEFAENPAQFSAKELHKDKGAYIEQQINELVRGLLINATTETYESLNPDELKRVKQRTIEEAPKLSKRQKRRQKQLAEQALSSTVKIDEEKPQIDIVEQDIDNLSLTLPWIDDGTEFSGSATEIRSGSRVVYVINGMEDKLQAIANETQDKEEIAMKINNAIDNQARILLDGYMPWERQTSAVKSLVKDGKAPKEYSDETIWYTFDLRPNAPRVYFVVKDVSEIESSEQPKLHPDAKCMVVVAITDKSQQISVLKRLTGQGHAYLVANGAGSV